MINIIVWLVVGGIVGWLASIITGRNSSMGIGLNIVVGIVGGAIGGFVMGVVGRNGTSINQSISLYSVVISLVGAVLLLAVVNVFTRGRARA